MQTWVPAFAGMTKCVGTTAGSRRTCLALSRSRRGLTPMVPSADLLLPPQPSSRGMSGPSVKHVEAWIAAFAGLTKCVGTTAGSRRTCLALSHSSQGMPLLVPSADLVLPQPSSRRRPGPKPARASGGCPACVGMAISLLVGQPRRPAITCMAEWPQGGRCRMVRAGKEPTLLTGSRIHVTASIPARGRVATEASSAPKGRKPHLGAREATLP